MNRYKILDIIRQTNIVGAWRDFYKIMQDDNCRLKSLELQKDNLSSFLKRLRGNEYYGKYLHGIADEAIEDNPYEIIQLFPLSDKSLLRTNFAKIRNEAFKGENNYTGGSTGSPFHYFCDKRLISRVIGFTIFSWSFFGGYNWSDNVIVVGGTSIGDKKSIKKKLLHFLQRRFYISGGEINLENAKTIASKINKASKPIILYGYPSSISQYIEIFKNCNIAVDYKKIKSILVTSETLTSEKRKKIESFFERRVVNLYGARDGGISAGTIDDDFIYNGIDCYVENINIDGVNELVITNMHSDAFPFVRYRIGDIGEVYNADNGYPFHIRNLVGRTRDFIVISDSHKIHGSIINKIFSHYPISEYQVIQRKDSSCDIAIIANDNININSIENDLKEKLVPLSIRVNIVDNIPRLGNSKLRNIICEMDN